MGDEESRTQPDQEATQVTLPGDSRHDEVKDEIDAEQHPDSGVANAGKRVEADEQAEQAEDRS